MLEELRISSIGVLEEAEVLLGSGLTVITGETGAGKSMLLGSLALASGAQADASLVRAGAEAARVEATFVLPPGPQARRVEEMVEEAGGTLDDGALIVTRTQPRAGRSRCHLGGRTVPRAVLADVVSLLVQVHGQADQLALRKPARQREVLDAFGGADHQPLLAAHAQAYHRWRAAQQAADDWTASAAERAREVETLSAVLAEVEALEVREGEEEELRAEAERLTNVEDLRAAAAGAHQVLHAEGGVTDLLSTVVRLITDIAQLDPAPRSWEETVVGARTALTDVAAEVGSYLEGLEADPQRLEAVHARRAALTQLLRGRATDVTELLAWCAAARDRLAEIGGGEDRTTELVEQAAAAHRELQAATATLTRARTALAERLATEIAAELAALAMPRARLLVDIQPGPVKAHGGDEVTLLLQTDPHLAAAPLASSASGGELSRIMLALEVVLARRQGEARTLIFDEVDAGVGGKAASEVGLRLAQLARHHQVLVVTHLAQVAAFADQHLTVTKEEGTTTVRPVQGAQRVREVARMLSGSDDTPTAFRHGEELIAAARVRLSET
ncbi:DNA repair protein RecN [Buchananella hordeovulneris]|uniref:DNA repair protein RecN n=1 Tax=Buchananella hordeovulneris TaxID=52770 RepID=A0A1Q5PXT3_9ACTO|nr:DNA repair protein RecN [Buchananella hordeovulneris]OKL52259.1 DNA repair protein RecN [Buchananella hordeovulneris]